MRIGEFLVQKKLLSVTDIEPILKHSERTGLRFGDAALEMGLLRREQLIEVFGPDFRTDFFHVESRHFPALTREWLTPEQLIVWGVLPLGVKSRSRWGIFSEAVLNLGMLSPSRSEVVAAVKNTVKEKAADVKPYLVLFDEYLEVMNGVYGWTPERIRSLGRTRIDPTLALFLGVE